MTSQPDPWTCRYCREHFVVPRLTELHEKVCPLGYGDDL